MKKSFFVLILMFLGYQAQAQNTIVPYRSVFLEVGGPGMVYSFNYDFRFDKNKLDSWGMRVGAGGYGTEGDYFFSVPLMVNKLYGKGPHYFEVGGGFTFFGYNNTYSWCSSGYFDANGTYVCTGTKTERNNYEFILPVDRSPNLMGTLNFGYRRIPIDGGFTWKFNLTPIFNNNGFWPLFAGIGFGYAF